jgi:hypothetical protein
MMDPVQAAELFGVVVRSKANNSFQDFDKVRFFSNTQNWSTGSSTWLSFLPLSGIYELLELGLIPLGKFVEDFRSSFANQCI